MVMLSFLFPDSNEIVVLGESKGPTLDGVRLGQLGKVHDQLFWESIPSLPLLHPQVDMCAGEFVDVEPDVFLPPILDEILVYKGKLSHFLGCLTDSQICPCRRR